MGKILSIVVPVYKVEDYLVKCVESLILGAGEENSQNIEIVLVDDGSPDSCPKICDELSSKYSNVKVIHKENGGVSSARNEGIKYATGEYVTFCDSDDFVGEDFKSIFNYIKQYPEMQVFSVGLIKNNKFISQFADEILNPQSFDDIYSIVKRDVTISCCAKIVKRSFVLENNLFFGSGIKSEDLVWSYKVLLKSNKYMLLNLSYYNYVDRETSVTHSTTLRGVESQVENYGVLFDVIKNSKFTTTEKTKILRYAMQGFIYAAYTSKFLKSEDKETSKKLFIKNKNLLYKPYGLKMMLYYFYLKFIYLK